MVGSLVDLRGAESWDLALLVAQTLRWPTTTQSLRLGEIAQVLPADTAVTAGAPVITPGGIDPLTGGVRRRSTRYAGPIHQVHQGSEALRIGDLLVPPSAHTPVLLVTADLVGSSISGGFTALRPVYAEGIWLWAVLNSRSGLAARATQEITSTADRAVSRSRLLSLPVPVPDIQTQRSKAAVLLKIAESARGLEEEPASSWWRTFRLPESGEWKTYLATPHPELLAEGPPLRQYCQDIQRGRVETAASSSGPIPGSRPVSNVRVLAGGPVTRWVKPTDRQVVAYPGDVLLAAVGSKPLSRVAEEESAVDRNVYVLRLHNRSWSHALAHYLNSRAGQALRNILLGQQLTASLSRRDLERIPVPVEVLVKEQKGDQPSIALADRLEEVVWG